MNARHNPIGAVDASMASVLVVVRQWGAPLTSGVRQRSYATATGPYEGGRAPASLWY